MGARAVTVFGTLGEVGTAQSVVVPDNVSGAPPLVEALVAELVTGLAALAVTGMGAEPVTEG